MDIGESPSSQEKNSLTPISAESFYGKHSKISENKISKREKVPINQDLQPLPQRLCSLGGPSQAWKIFRKQKDALDYVKTQGNGLMTFAFQQESGQRLFLVCHPLIFWHYDSKRISHQRCTYEIIPEYTPCKIYFDLEYDAHINTHRDPEKIVTAFITIVSNHLLHFFDVRVDKSNVLILDSSTEAKFSCHLIYQSVCAIFRDNIHLGRFVKEVCFGIRRVVSDPNVAHENPLLWMGVSYSDICDLVVCGRKNDKKLFCDESVYSKNRHFRLYNSTKLGKNAPLILSNFNECFPNADTPQEKIFLSSLVTYIEGKCVQPLKFGCERKEPPKKVTPGRMISTVSELASSQPELDEFVANLISPLGTIRKRSIIDTSKGRRIQFDIQGYRFCANIGRHHRSNNIYIVLDGSRGTWYQKCYDPDCSGFQSEERPLPPEVSFIIEEDPDVGGEDILMWDNSFVCDEIFVEFGTFGDCGSSEKEALMKSCGSSDIPDFGIGDDELMGAASNL